MIIDAHQHFWHKVQGADQGPGSRSRSYLPHHLGPILQSHTIDKTIAVQASPSLEENRFLLEMANKREEVIGVVGWVELGESDALQRLAEFKEDPHFVGIRPMLQDLPSGWLLQRVVLHNLNKCADDAFPVDLQANPRHLPAIIELLKNIPHLHGVIDHIAKPPMDPGHMEPWASHMREIAEYPNIMCKVSGLVPEKVGASWKTADIYPYVEHILDVFGPKRVMFGSDWPVCLKSASYPDIIQLFEETVVYRLSEAEREDVYGNNACCFYKLDNES
ncbi:amidohydrolase family protein [Terribacillus sp. 179-K 1B1 HS]|uniref:amidohydrolase family protein n=1 Tax=Terribacillus sp. 179-K 1B1 HS TaxID=3142388 RepID=UPI0039A3EC7D